STTIAATRTTSASGSTPRHSAPRPERESMPGTSSAAGSAAASSRLRPLLGSNVGAREATIDQEGRGGHVRGLVAGQEQGTGGDLARLGEPPHRQVHDAPRGLLRVAGEKLGEQRRA